MKTPAFGVPMFKRQALSDSESVGMSRRRSRGQFMNNAPDAPSGRALQDVERAPGRAGPQGRSRASREKRQLHTMACLPHHDLALQRSGGLQKQDLAGTRLAPAAFRSLSGLSARRRLECRRCLPVDPPVTIGSFQGGLP